jgi:hypothetical protein
MKLLVAHTHVAPDPPSARTELPIPAELESSWCRVSRKTVSIDRHRRAICWSGSKP